MIKTTHGDRVLLTQEKNEKEKKKGSINTLKDVKQFVKTYFKGLPKEAQQGLELMIDLLAKQ
jgi:hypothetical protein